MTDTARIYCNDPNGYHKQRDLSWISTFTHSEARWREELIPRAAPSTGDDAQEYHQTSRFLVDRRGVVLYRVVYKRAPGTWPDIPTPQGFFDHRARDGSRLLLTYEDVATGREYPDGVPAYDDVVYLFECGCGTSSQVPQEVLFRGLDALRGQGRIGLTIAEVAEWA